MKHALPWETKWPQIKKGDYARLFLASIYILFLGCHFYPSSTSTATSSNNTLHSITIQASDSVASLCNTSILHNKTWENYLVLFLMVLCLVFIVPIVFHSFYKSVYDFGPKHCKRSFWDILTQLVPGTIEFKGRLGKSADFDSL
jgi:hypothetical protein